jgi:alanine racemase
MIKGVATWAEINLDVIVSNVKAIKRHIGHTVEIIAVLKANAYGHGAVHVAPTILEAGATRLAVHRLIEGIELRKAGIAAPILILGYTSPDSADLVIQWRLTPTLTTYEFANTLSSLAMIQGLRIPVHVKVDTGMHRYGLYPNEVVDFLHALSSLPGIDLEGLFTHFATADWENQTFVHQQNKIFRDVLASAKASGLQIPLVHAANSAAIMSLPEAHFDAVRPGIAIYGMEPSIERKSIIRILPALTLKSKVNQVQLLPKGEAIGYGRAFITQESTHVALIPVGYGDGYYRIFSNRGLVLVHGQRAPILGRISMDQLVADVTQIPDVQLDEEVVLIGTQDHEALLAEEVAALAGTLNYEVTTSLSPRVVRIYLRNGEICQVSGLD